MFQRFVDAANANPGICGIILCGIILIAVLILTLDRRREKRMKARIRQLKKAVETKEVLIVHKDAEIQRLNVDLFMAREDGKIALRKKQAEVDRLTARVAQLEQDKKQLTKWGK